MKDLGLTGPASAYELDHFVPLETGGHPTDPNNLWVEPWNGSEGAHKKDMLENKLKRLVCNGTITLKEAQQNIITDWEDAYNKYVTNEK